MEQLFKDFTKLTKTFPDFIKRQDELNEREFNSLANSKYQKKHNKN